MDKNLNVYNATQSWSIQWRWIQARLTPLFLCVSCIPIRVCTQLLYLASHLKRWYPVPSRCVLYRNSDYEKRQLEYISYLLCASDFNATGSVRVAPCLDPLPFWRTFQALVWQVRRTPHELLNRGHYNSMVTRRPTHWILCPGKAQEATSIKS